MLLFFRFLLVSSPLLIGCVIYIDPQLSFSFFSFSYFSFKIKGKCKFFFVVVMCEMFVWRALNLMSQYKTMNGSRKVNFHPWRLRSHTWVAINFHSFIFRTLKCAHIHTVCWYYFYFVVLWNKKKSFRRGSTVAAIPKEHEKSSL